MTKPGQEGAAQSPPPPWREESSVFPELSPGPEGPDIADISLEKKRPELPWRKKGEERAGETQRRSEQPLVSGHGSVLEQEGAAAGGSLAELWDACDAPTGQGGPAQGHGVQWRVGGTRGHNLLDRKGNGCTIAPGEEGQHLAPNASQHVCVSAIISLFSGPDASPQGPDLAPGSCPFLPPGDGLPTPHTQLPSWTRGGGKSERMAGYSREVILNFLRNYRLSFKTEALFCISSGMRVCVTPRPTRICHCRCSGF